MKTMVIILSVLASLVAGTYLFMQQAVFGENPTGKALERIEQSVHYQYGSFQNSEETPMYPPDISYWKMTKHLLFKPKDVKPAKALPSVKTNLNTLQADKPTIVWFGHSSYLIKSKDFVVLIDPVLSGKASPVSFFGKAFEGADSYKAEDMPMIDMLIISHDHYDHLDYETMSKLAPKVKHIYTSLGVGSHLEHWGIAQKKITELDWWQAQTISPDIALTATPARHFSGRGFTRGKSFWSSFVLNLHGYQLFLGGDSGEGNHFDEIAQKFGSFDIAFLENGQYAPEWPYIHTFPEQTSKIAKRLNTKVLMPVHWAKFELSYHPWNEPIKRLVKAAQADSVALCTPIIGQPVILGEKYPTEIWWE